MTRAGPGGGSEIPEDPFRAVEDEVRAMLRRRAADVDPKPPPWGELSERSGRQSEAVVVPLRAAAPRHRAPGRAVLGDGRRRWARVRRPAFAAALVFALALSGSLAATGGWSSRRVGDGPTAEVAAPGAPAFRPGAAPPVWASGTDEPVDAARAYLAATGIATDSTAAAPATVTARDVDGGVAVVDWSVASDSHTWGGTVFLRSSAGEPRHVWTVVGAVSNDVSLDDVRYDGDRLAFTITRAAEGDDQLAVGVWADGQPVALNRDAVSSGIEPVVIDDHVGAEHDMAVDVDGATAIVLIVYQVDRGRVRSVSHMAIGGERDAGSGSGSSGEPHPDGTERPGGATSTSPPTTTGSGMPDAPAPDRTGTTTTSVPPSTPTSEEPTTFDLPEVTTPPLPDLTIPMPPWWPQDPDAP